MKMKEIIAAIWLVLIFGISALSHATVSSKTAKVSYTCNGVLATYAYTFKIFEDDDLLAIKTLTATGTETTLVLNTDYTVTGAGNTNGGNVILTAASKCASGYSLTLLRNMDITQETDYVDGEAFSATSFENALDRLTIGQQQHGEALDRALKNPVKSTATLPGAVAGNYIGWNDTATALENKITALQVGATAGTADNLFYADPDAADQGATTNPRSIASLLASIGTSKSATIVLAHSSSGNMTTYTVTTPVTFASYPLIKLSVESGAIISGTLTGLRQQVKPEWWALNTIPGTTDMSTALNAASAASTEIILSNRYKHSTTWSVPSGRKIHGVSRSSTLESWNVNGITIIEAARDEGVEIYDFQMTSFTAVGAPTTGSPINKGITAIGDYAGVGGPFYSISIHDMQFQGWDTAIYFYDIWDSKISYNQFVYNQTGIDLTNLSARINITDNMFVADDGVVTTSSCIILNRDNYTSEGVIISNNKLYDHAFGVKLPLLGSGISILGNEFDNTISAIYANINEGLTIVGNYYMRSSGSEPTIKFPDQGALSAKKVVVANNYIINAGTGVGIYLGELQSDYTVIGNVITSSETIITVSANVTNTNISGNIGKVDDASSISTIAVFGGTRLSITDNVNVRVKLYWPDIVDAAISNNTFTQKTSLNVAVPTTGTWNQGDIVYKQFQGTAPYTAPNQSSLGDIIGWVSTSSGTFSAATDNTGDTTLDSQTITGLTDTSDFYPGDYVTISAGFASATTPMQIITKTATTLTFDEYSNGTQANVTIATVDPIFRAFGQRGYREGAVSPAGVITPYFIGEEYLDSTANIWYKSYGVTNVNWAALN